MNSLKIEISFLLILFLAACGRGNGHDDVETGVATFDSIIYSPKYASGFEILGSKGRGSTILRVTKPWQGADNVSCDLFIQRDGESVPPDFIGQVIENSAGRVVCMSSTHVAMLDMLGDVKKIVGISSPQFVHNAYVAANPNKIGDIGYDGNINYEVIVASNPDLVLLYGISGRSEFENKLIELGIPFVYLGDYLEESPLGKAEWLVATGEIMGKRERAEGLFSQIPVRYEEMKRQAASFESRPKVMINTPYADSWLMASANSYIARLIDDAGADYVFKDNNSGRSMPIDMEQAYILADASDFWINTGAAKSIDELTHSFPRFADVKPVRNGNIFNCNRRLNNAGGNDYWESGALHPDLVLRDLIKIFHPGEFPNDTLIYYRKL